MNLKWFTTVIAAAAHARRSVATPFLQGPVLIRGGVWGGFGGALAGVSGLDFGYVLDVGGSVAQSPTGQGFIIENNVAIATPPAYTRFNSGAGLAVLQNDSSPNIRGFSEFASTGGPANYRPLHFVIPSPGGRLVIAVENDSAGGLTVGANIEVCENIPQAFLDCLKHLVM